jgi:hypothetical protein
MTSPDERIRGDNIRKYFAELCGQAKNDTIHNFLERYRKRAQELLNIIESEPEPDLAQTLQTSVTEIGPLIPSEQPATPDAIRPQQELTDISPCDCFTVGQQLRLVFERLTLGPSTAEKRAQRGRVDDDDTDGQPAAKRRKLSDGRSSHRLSDRHRG